MFGPVERMIARRYLQPRKAERFVSLISLISLLGILLGVATLVVVMSVMNGFRFEIVERLVGINGHVTVNARSGVIVDVEALRSVIEPLEPVVGTNAMVDGQALLIHKGAARGTLVRGIPPEVLRERPLFADALLEGSFDRFSGNTVLIGEAAAQRMGVSVGDRISLVAPRGHAGPFGTLPRMRSYPVVGIFKLGMYNYDNGAVFMPLEAAVGFYGLSGQAGAIEVFLDDPAAATGVVRRLAPALGVGFHVIDWQSSNSTLITALEVERVVMFVILSLIILVAAFNMISSLIMLVKDKSADIAILRTMGASRGRIVRIFFLAGASIGVAGTVLGVGLGLLVASHIETIRGFLEGFTGTRLFDETLYFLSRLPSRIVLSDVVAIVSMALALSFSATLYPAWRAARIDPVEALRYE